MEDIKILEEQLEQYKRHLENYEKENCLTSVYYELKKYAGALENLIKAYKELEEENIILKGQNEYQYDLGWKSCEIESVPKSLIKEKIEEKQKRIDKMHPVSDCVLIDDLENQIQVLEELLGKEK